MFRNEEQVTVHEEEPFEGGVICGCSGDGGGEGQSGFVNDE